MTFNPMQIMQMMMQGGNPQAFMQNMIRQNPQINAIFNQQRQSGLSMEQYARQYAKQNNIDINQYINNMKQMGMKF